MSIGRKRKKDMQDAYSGIKEAFSIVDVLFYLCVGLTALVCLYPILNVLAISLSGYQEVLSNSVTWYPKNISFAAYRDIFRRKQIWQAMGTTILVTVYGTAAGLVLTTSAAYVLSRNNLPGRKFFSAMILFTMYFSGGIIPTFVVVKGLGLVDTLGALFIPQAVSVFNFVIMRTFFRELPESLEESAQIDGATELQVLFKIVLPLSVPIIATVGLFYAVQYWNDYFQSLIYITTDTKYTLQLRLRSFLFGQELDAQAQVSGDRGQIMTQSLKMASIMFATLPILVVYPWLQKYFVKGMMLGSVKG